MNNQGHNIGTEHQQPNPQVTPTKRGRPAKYASAAEKQKAYRERQKAKGLREVKRYILDGDAPLSSDTIDLSEVRPWSHRPNVNDQDSEGLFRAG